MQRVYFIALLLVLSALTFVGSADVYTAPAVREGPSQRIVSLAPSITETLGALGLQQRVVGITQYCTYPPDMLHIPRVAGFSEAWYEAIVRQKPDLVILPADKVHIARDLARLGLRILPVDTRSLQGLLHGITTIGHAVGTERAAQILRDQMQTSINAARHARGGNAPRVLLSILQEISPQGDIMQVTAIGQDGFFNDLLLAAGGVNVYQGTLPYPRLSREAITRLNPDVIIAIAPHASLPAAAATPVATDSVAAADALAANQTPNTSTGACRDAADALAADQLAAPQEAVAVHTLRAAWQRLQRVHAIRNGRLFIVTERACTVPGPRAVMTLRLFSRLFYPDTAQ